MLKKTYARGQFVQPTPAQPQRPTTKILLKPKKKAKIYNGIPSKVARQMAQEERRLRALKPPKVKRKYNPEDTLIFQAKEYYVRGFSAEEIHAKTNLPLEFIKKCIRQKSSGWQRQRDRAFDKITKELVISTLPVLRSIMSNGLAIIDHSFADLIKKVQEQNREIKLSEATMVAQILAFVAKEKRLDEGDPTERIEKNLTPTEIISFFANDPYLGKSIKQIIDKSVPIEAEFVEQNKELVPANGAAHTNS